jgi:hypothetical protein
MSGGSGVARLAFRIVIGIVVTARILMRHMTGGASKMPASEAAALHQPQRLKPDVFGLVVANRRFHAMTRAAKFHLRFGGEFTRIHRHSMTRGMLRGTWMAALALHSGNGRLKTLFVNFGGVTRKTRSCISLALLQAQSILRITRSAGILADGDAVLMKLREIADA